MFLKINTILCWYADEQLLPENIWDSLENTDYGIGVQLGKCKGIAMEALSMAITLVDF